MTTTVAIVSHSGYGHTDIVTEAVAEGVKAGGATPMLMSAEDAAADLDRLDDAHAIVMGAPTYMGGPSAQFKAFADASSKKWMSGSWEGKLAAGFTTSGSLSGDKHITLIYFVTLAMQHKMIWVGQGEAAPSTSSGHGGKPEDINRVGSSLGLMTQSDNAPPEETPAPGDIETARLFGKRIATYATKLHG